MNKLVILATALLISAFAPAQQPERKGPPPPNWRNAQDKKQSMLEELNLTDAQKEQLKKERMSALEKYLQRFHSPRTINQETMVTNKNKNRTYSRSKSM